MKLKTTLLSILLVVIVGIQILKSQENNTIKDTEYMPLIEENKTWSVTHNSCWHPPEPQTFYTITFLFSGDTVINDIIYKKQYISTIENPEFPDDYRLSGNFWRENIETKQVWKKNSRTEKLIYDFSLETGDIILHEYGDFDIQIDSISYLTMNNGEERKVFYLGYYHTNSPILSCKEYIIEGIGSNLGLEQAYTKTLVGGSNDLLCIKENNDLIYMNSEYNTCYRKNSTLHTNIDEIENNIKIYPNPVKNNINIQNDNNIYIKSVLLMDIKGKIIKQYYTNISGIDVSDMFPGIYLLKISTNDGYIINKIIIEE